MNDEKFEKILRDVKWVSIFILVLVVIMFIKNLSVGALNTLSIIIKFIQIALLLGTAIGCKNRMLYGPICGIITAILMILALNIFDTILGIAFLIECVTLIKYMKN